MFFVGKKLKYMNQHHHHLYQKKYQEHCGRVRGLGLGPCPSKVFGSKGHSYNGTSSSYPSNAQLQNQVNFLVLIMMHYFYQI